VGLVNDVLKYVVDVASDGKIDGVCLGLKYSSVLLEDGRCGVAYRFRNWMSTIDRPSIEYGFDAAKLCLEWDLNVASLGTAAVNSLLPDPGGTKVEGYRRIKELCKDARFVVFVGYFKPFLDIPSRYVVIEKSFFEGVLPDEAYQEYLPMADLAVISGSAFVNKSLEKLLKASGGYNLVVGLTTPPCRVLFEYGVDELLYSKVVDGRQVYRLVSLGGGSSLIKKHSVQLSIRR